MRCGAVGARRDGERLSVAETERGARFPDAVLRCDPSEPRGSAAGISVLHLRDVGDSRWRTERRLRFTTGGGARAVAGGSPPAGAGAI